MNLNEMTADELRTRQAEIRAIAENPENVSEDELRSLRDEAASIAAEIEKRRAEAETRAAVAAGAGTVTGEPVIKPEERKMTVEEIRRSADYVNAYANYIKTGKDEECRALLSTNGTNVGLSLTGYVPVPEIVEGKIRTAWEKNGLMSLVRKTYLKGNVRVGFERSTTGASVHIEGDDAPDEETLVLGIVEMIPKSIKKWITISDEAIDLSGSEFIDYIYDELAYQIAKKAESELVTLIAALPDTATASSVSAQAVAAAPAVDTIAKLIGVCKGQNLTVAMNRGTWAEFKAAQYAANWAVDVFEGLPVVFTDALPAYADADEEDVYIIVGDFGNGAQANFPNGDEITIKYDDLSLAEADLVKIVGREFVALGAVQCDAFALGAVPEAEEDDAPEA